MDNKTESKSIISDDYRKANKNKEPDWVKNFMIDQAYTLEQLKEGSKKKPELLMNRTMLIELATKNGCGEKAAKYSDDGKYNNGNVAMSIGNILRAVAKKRFGLVKLDESFKKIPVDDPLVIDLDGPTQKRDGTPIKAKKEKEDA